jgi:hypothetical protein
MEHTPKQTADDNMLPKLEQVSICALAAYTAHEYGVSEDLVVAITTSHFGVDSISKILPHDFDAAIRYLVDLNPKEQIN